MQTFTNISCQHTTLFGSAKNSRLRHSQNTGNQHSCCCQNNTPFTGKERDRETGFSYFGARYYDSDLSGLFLSVDPMADKYPNLSPYAYCAWNPVKLVDPDGNDGVCVVNGKNLMVNVIVNYSQKGMDEYLKQIDYNHSDAFKNDFAHYYQSVNGTYSICGNDYNISFNITFNNVDDLENFSAEKGSMSLKFDMGNNNSNYLDNVITMGNSPRFDEENKDFKGSFSHEVLHGLGIADTKEASSGKLSSYSYERMLTLDEITEMLEPCIQFINKNGIQKGKVLIPENNHYSTSRNSRAEPVLLE